MTPTLASIVLGVFAVIPPVVQHETRGIKDGAGLFTSSTIVEAQRRIDRAKANDQDGIDLKIETVTELPELPASALRKMRNRQSKELLRKAAQDRAKEASCRGLFVLVVKEPRHITVVGCPEDPYELKVSSVKRENLRKYLVRELGTDPDRALLGACDHFDEIVGSIQARPATPLKPLTALAVIGTLFGAWILLRFVRSRVVSPALPIYQPAMQGSLFGVPSGYWIYDRLYQAECPLTHPAHVDPLAMLASPEPAPEPEPVDAGDAL